MRVGSRIAWCSRGCNCRVILTTGAARFFALRLIVAMSDNLPAAGSLVQKNEGDDPAESRMLSHSVMYLSQFVKPMRTSLPSFGKPLCGQNRSRVQEGT